MIVYDHVCFFCTHSCCIVHVDWKDGVWLMEKCWRGFGHTLAYLETKMTKEMSSSHREDVLSDALFYLAKKLKSRIGTVG